MASLGAPRACILVTPEATALISVAMKPPRRQELLQGFFQQGSGA